MLYFPSEKEMASLAGKLAHQQKQQSDIQIEEVTKDTQCGFCGLTLDEMQQPQALPCGHVHCAECIQVNYQHKEIECKTSK